MGAKLIATFSYGSPTGTGELRLDKYPDHMIITTVREGSSVYAEVPAELFEFISNWIMTAGTKE